jgi:hypothetical protein
MDCFAALAMTAAARRRVLGRGGGVGRTDGLARRRLRCGCVVCGHGEAGAVFGEQVGEGFEERGEQQQDRLRERSAVRLGDAHAQLLRCRGEAGIERVARRRRGRAVHARKGARGGTGG